MIQIDDLHFKTEIIPLFDFVTNDYSREVLVQVLSEVPGTLNEVLLRQDILKGIIKNEHLLQFYFYSPSEFNEVYLYLNELKTRLLNLKRSSWRLLPVVSKRQRERDRSRLAQFVIFFNRLYQVYFYRMSIATIPQVLGKEMERAGRLFLELEIEANSLIARKRAFTSAEVIRLHRGLCESIKTGELDFFWKFLFRFEAYISIAKGILTHKFIFPEFSERGLSIRQFYHPLVKNPVRNDLDLTNSMTVITGPNMSGKSTLLKAVGLCVYMAHLGLAVPAQKCELVYYEVISVVVNPGDDIQSGYSHFMMEVKQLKYVVVEAMQSKKCFAIFDELFRGTNVEDATAISKTTIGGLAGFRNSHFIISTHLYNLKEVVEKNAQISTFYIGCNITGNTPSFTYCLQQGWSDLKIGQLLFKKEGLDKLLGGM